MGTFRKGTVPDLLRRPRGRNASWPVSVRPKTTPLPRDPFPSSPGGRPRDRRPHFHHLGGRAKGPAARSPFALTAVPAVPSCCSPSHAKYSLADPGSRSRLVCRGGVYAEVLRKSRLITWPERPTYAVPGDLALKSGFACRVRRPLTPTLSPKAGRGSRCGTAPYAARRRLRVGRMPVTLTGSAAAP
jgi:hypothetical protein